eukprot:maker-scaffold2030_size22264-snap-gene-0.8 protein:Tk07616 transcript:maker-scaffold2030_size22264-snap-gene-0.8-mRNA-1 annotation:"calpain-b-like isoform 2"
MTTINLEEAMGEYSPEELDELEVIEATTLDTTNSPFANMLLNMLEGGGRAMKAKVQSGEIDPGAQPCVENGMLYGQEFETLRQEALASGDLFTDPEFPPDDASLYFSQSAPYSFEWKRPRELSNDPALFEGGASRFDINQGELGDCWLLAALANLTLNKKLLYRVVPVDQSFTEDYAGIFHFQFWQYGEWVDVVIDDFLPTRGGKLMFMHSGTPNEFWTALLEKAYAKLHGSYESLKGGSTCEAMVDFTGGCGEMYQLKERGIPEDMFSIMRKAYERCSMMSCSLTPDPSVTEARTDVGLIKGHAYSITKVVKARIETPRVQGQIPLVRIRNPWGNEAEWNGAWSDGSPEWQYIPDDEKEILGINFEHDGEFWMSYKDFMRYFDQIEICNLTPDSLEDSAAFCDRPRWEVTSWEGVWLPGKSAGGCRNSLDTFANNPQFLITVEDPDDTDGDDLCTIIISLMQKGRRALRDEGMDMLTIGFALYFVKDPGAVSLPLDTDFFRYTRSAGRSNAFINLREVSQRFRVPPGAYAIIPSTFRPDEFGQFLLRVFSEKSSTCEQINE